MSEAPYIKGKHRNRRKPKYGVLIELYPDHFKHFVCMFDRLGRSGVGFTRDGSGFLEFVECIGPYPVDMVSPEVGRIDHSKGYVRGNFKWQSHHDNMKEMLARVKPNEFRRGTTVTEETRKNMSMGHKGKPWSEARRKAHEDSVSNQARHLR